MFLQRCQLSKGNVGLKTMDEFSCQLLQENCVGVAENATFFLLGLVPCWRKILS